MAVKSDSKLTKREKAAVFLISVGKVRAAQIFKHLSEEEIAALTLAITAGVPGDLANLTLTNGGSISGTAANGKFYDNGTVLSVLASTPVLESATKQWGFDHWNGDATGTTNPASVTISAPRSVTANYSYPTADLGNNGPVNEGSPATVSFTNQSGVSPFHYAYACDGVSPGTATYANTAGSTASAQCTYPEGPSTHTVRARIIDKNDGFSEYATIVTVDNVVPTVGPITAVPSGPQSINSTISFSANFTDPGTLDTHTAVWDFGDGSTCPPINAPNTTCGLTGAAGSGSVTASHKYTTSGVFTVNVTVTDDDNGSGVSTYEFVVIYDANNGFVTGGGWIDSPPGAYGDNPSLTGKANFGFVSKYKKGATVPDGNTEFQFKAGDLNFHSESYVWMVISGAKARYRGTGTINGGSTLYEFELTAWDEQVNGGGGVDKFRIHIYGVYDNQMGDTDGNDPTTALGGGSIVIHK
jgi:hypothetical protein